MAGPSLPLSRHQRHRGTWAIQLATQQLAGQLSTPQQLGGRLYLCIGAAQVVGLFSSFPNPVEMASYQYHGAGGDSAGSALTYVGSNSTTSS